MHTHNNQIIISSRVLNFSVVKVYEAFSNPIHLRNWWGPNGFNNTIHEFDLQAGGKWLLTMHGADGVNYENESVFDVVHAYQLVSWKRISKPLFDMELVFDKLDVNTTKFSFRMFFQSEDECQKMKAFISEKNEENFDRLEKVLAII